MAKLDDAEMRFKLQPTPVPEVLKTGIAKSNASQKMERGLERQRQMLSKIIFPSHIPGPCHPNVTSMENLIKDLQEAGKTDAAFTKDDLETLQSNPRNASSTPLNEIEVVRDKCNVYSRRANHFRKSAKTKQDEGADKNSIIEAVAMSKIYDLNYRYCIASISCPQRIAVLNNCFNRHPPEVVQAIAKAGQHQYLCGKERKSVERCSGQKVESVMRKILE